MLQFLLRAALMCMAPGCPVSQAVWQPAHRMKLGTAVALLVCDSRRLERAGGDSWRTAFGVLIPTSSGNETASRLPRLWANAMPCTSAVVVAAPLTRECGLLECLCLTFLMFEFLVALGVACHFGSLCCRYPTQASPPCPGRMPKPPVWALERQSSQALPASSGQAS